MGSEGLDLSTDELADLKRELLERTAAAGFEANVRDEPTSGTG
jgi:hypothetical protein